MRVHNGVSFRYLHFKTYALQRHRMVTHDRCSFRKWFELRNNNSLWQFTQFQHFQSFRWNLCVKASSSACKYQKHENLSPVECSDCHTFNSLHAYIFFQFRKIKYFEIDKYTKPQMRQLTTEFIPKIHSKVTTTSFWLRISCFYSRF